MFAQESVMEIQNEKEAFERFKAKQIGIDYETLKKDLDDCEKRFPNNRYAGWNFKSDWELWQAATALPVPDGFVLVPVKEIKTWYLDDSENIYREDPEWLCDIPVGEVVEVEHRVSYELDQDPVFAAIQWDEENSDVGYYETFKSKVEAEKVAAHCKAMVEAQEQAHD